MDIRKIINKRLRHEGDGVHLAGDVNAVISANVGEPGSVSKTSSRQRTRIVQRSGETVAETTDSQDEKEGNG